MKTLGVFIALLVLCSFGLSIGGLLWEGGQIPAWLISLFLLPAALFLDYFTKGGGGIPIENQEIFNLHWSSLYDSRRLSLYEVPGCTDYLCLRSCYALYTFP